VGAGAGLSARDVCAAGRKMTALALAAWGWASMPGVPASCAFEGAAAQAIETATGARGLAGYLQAVAWHESRCRPSARGDGGRAAGAYQMHKNAAGAGLGPLAGALARRARAVPVLGTAIAARYALHLRRKIGPCPATWGAVRRAWAAPRLACATSDTARRVDRRFQHARSKISE